MNRDGNAEITEEQVAGWEADIERWLAEIETLRRRVALARAAVTSYRAARSYADGTPNLEAGVRSGDGRASTLNEAVAAILKRNGGEMSPQDVRDRLRDVGYEGPINRSFYGAFTRLIDAGRILRTGRGFYAYVGRKET